MVNSHKKKQTPFSNNNETILPDDGKRKKSRRNADKLTRPFEAAALIFQSRRFFALAQTYDDLQGHGSRLEVDLPCPFWLFIVPMSYIN